MKKPLPTGDALRELAQELGVVITIDDPTEPSGDYKMFRAVISESEIQRRVIDAQRLFQAERMWLIAVIAAVTSVISAIAAWCAVFLKLSH